MTDNQNIPAPPSGTIVDAPAQSTGQIPPPPSGTIVDNPSQNGAGQPSQTPPANLNAGLSESHGASSTWADEKKAPQPEHPAAKHGLLRRAWDFVNTPIADFVLPEGVKTEDLVKAAAFERMYNEAYIPGVNDFKTKAEVHLGDGKSKAAVKAFINGSAADTATVGAGLTSPLSLAAAGLGAAAKAPGALGTVAKTVGPLVGSAFTLQGANQAYEGAKEYQQARDTNDEQAKAAALSKMAGGAGQSILGGVGTAHELGAAREAVGDYVKGKTALTTEESPMGAQIPARQDNRIANAAAARTPEVAEKFAQGETAPAVQQAIGGTVGEALGSNAATTLTPEDRFGLKGHANDIIENQARPAFKRVDELSGSKLTDAQNKIDSGWGQMDKAKIAEGVAEKRALYDQYRDQLKSEGLDIDAADANYGKGKTAERMAKRLETATGPTDIEGLPYEVKPQVLRNVIDKGVQNGSWKRMGLTDSHIAELESLGKTMAEQADIPKVSRTIAGLGKMATLISGLHGGMFPAIEAITGMSAADYISNRVSRSIMQDAMLDYDATKALRKAVQSGDPAPVVDALKKDPTWVDKTKQYVKDSVKGLIQKYRESKISSEKGAVGANVKNFSQQDLADMKKLGISESDVATKHSQDLRDFSKDYMGGKELDTTQYPADSRGADIADAYDAMKHDPTDPKVKASYDALINETKDQWEQLKARGYTMSTSKEQPYANAEEMLKDIRDNKHITVWEGGKPPADHPMSSVDEGTGLTNNTLFRAVHDILGHAKEGNDFSEAGEENAFRQHSQMYSENAQPALATETKGQASHVFNNELVRNGEAKPGDFFPEQKAALLPDEFHGGKGAEVLNHIKGNRPFAVLTAENPMNTRVSDVENARLNAKLISDLRKKGYASVAVEGHNADVEGNKEHSFFVPDITAEDAAALGRKYKQSAVLTHEGLHDLTKNTVNPSDNPKLLTGDAATKEPYYSTVNGKPFSVPLDFSKEVPVAATSGTPATTMNASGESSASIEAQNRLRSQQAQGLKVYDVDSRKANSPAAWHPVLASVDRVDMTAQPYHHLVEIDPKTGQMTVLDSGRGAQPLPANDRIQELIGQATPETPATTRPEVAAEAAYRQGLEKKELGTRQPFSAGAETKNNPSAQSGLDALNEADKESPSRITQAGKPVLGIKQKLVAALSDYKNNGISNLLDAANPNASIEAFVNHAKENLKWLHGVTPEVIRDAAKQWYETAHNTTKKLADANGISHEQAAAVTAALSPQNDWNNNVGQAQRIIEHWKNDQNHAWTSKMDSAFSEIRNGGQVSEPMRRAMDTVRGKRYNQLTAKTPEALLAKKALWIRILDEAHNAKDTPIYAPDGTVKGSQTLAWNSVDPMAKAISILEDGSLDNINATMGLGHKIRNFYNNIINPWSKRGHATIDTHQVGASLLKPFSGDDVEVAHNFGSGNKAGMPSPAKHAGTGLRGSYPVYEEAVRRAANELGIQPRELQSITWEGIRALMGDEKKTPELKRAVNDIWRAHEEGQLTLPEAREEILKATGGFSKPNWISDEDWERSGGSPQEGQTDFSFGENANPNSPANEAGIAMIPREQTTQGGYRAQVGTVRIGKDGKIDVLKEVPISSLKMPEGNRLRPADVEKYKADIESGKGVDYPVVENGVVDNGNHRVEATRQTGARTVKVWERKSR